MFGCAGGSAPRDREFAGRGPSTKPTPAPQADRPVTYFDAETVQAAFAKGGVLADGKGTNYQVITGRRAGPGSCEVHTFDTDVIYVLKGEAIFVTGGKALDSKETAPGEFRGRSIEGGTDRKLAKGDVIIVPAGTPHWFKEVKGQFHYFLIKVR